MIKKLPHPIPYERYESRDCNMGCSHATASLSRYKLNVFIYQPYNQICQVHS